MHGMPAVGIRARSFDPKIRTFEFVLASETPCRTYRYDRNWNCIKVDDDLPMSAVTSLVRDNGWALQEIATASTADRIGSRADMQHFAGRCSETAVPLSAPFGHRSLPHR